MEQKTNKLTRIRMQLGLVENERDPIVRGNKVAMLAAQVAILSQGAGKDTVQAPFRESKLRQVVREASQKMSKDGFGVPKKEPMKPKTGQEPIVPERTQRVLPNVDRLKSANRGMRVPGGIKAISRVGRGIERGVAGFADWLSDGESEAYIQGNPLLSAVRGVGRAARSTQLLVPGARKKLAAVRRGEESRIRAEAMKESKSAQTGGVATQKIIDRVEKAEKQILNKEDIVESKVEKSKSDILETLESNPATKSKDKLRDVEAAREAAMKRETSIEDEVVAGIKKSGIDAKIDEILKEVKKMKGGSSLLDNALSAAGGAALGRRGGRKGPAGRTGKVRQAAKAAGRGLAALGAGALRVAPLAARFIPQLAVASTLVWGATAAYGAIAPRMNQDFSGHTNKIDKNGSSSRGQGPSNRNKPLKLSPSTLGLTDPIAKFVAQKEGVELQAYSDSGQYPTIGVGHLITKKEISQGFIDIGDGTKVMIPKGNPLGTTMTKEQAKALYMNVDLPKHASIAKRQLGDESWSKLTEGQRAALVSYAFNRGSIDGLIKRGLRDSIEAGDIDAAASIIANGVRTSRGKFVPGLVNRREAEAQVFKSGFKEEKKYDVPSSIARPKTSTPGRGEAVAEMEKQPSKQTVNNVQQIVQQAQPPRPQAPAQTPVQMPVRPTRNPTSSLQATQIAESYRSL